MVDNATMPSRLFILFGLFVCTIAWGTEIEPTPMLQDQYGQSSGLGDYSGEAVLAIIATPRKLRWIGKWEEAIRAEIPALRSIRIADVTDRPAPDYQKVASMLRKKVPQDISVLIDLQSHWASRYILDTSEPCLVLFDSDHHVVTKFRGRPKGELVNEVLNALRHYFLAADES
jgi:hypothetical protein